MSTYNPLLCENCGRKLEADDAVSIIEGTCAACRLEGADAAAPRVAKNQMGVSPVVSPQSLRAAPPIADTKTEDNSSLRNHDDDELPDLLEQLAYGEKVADPIRSSPSPQHSAETTPPRRIEPVAFPQQTSARLRSHRGRQRLRDLTIGTAAGLFLTIGVTSYFLFSRSTPSPSLAYPIRPVMDMLVLRVTPAWASVRVDDQILDSPDAAGKLAISLDRFKDPGHLVEVSADGYHTDRRPLSSLIGVDQVFIELVRKPYDVVIQTDPEQAEVWVNDKLKGYTPLTLSMLPHEQASLTLKRRGYEVLSQTIAPPERGVRQEIHLPLTPAGPVLRVESDPAGARVTVDGKPQGTTPLAMRLEASYLGREVMIAAESSGYAPAEMHVAIPAIADEELDAIRLTLQRLVIQVQIETMPPGGAITIEGQSLGAAPVTAQFDTAQVGRSVVVQAVLAGTHYGRQEFIIPPAGDVVRIVVPMDFTAQRVAMVLALSGGNPKGNRALRDWAVDLIHRLTPKQRLAILAQGDAGFEAWPGGRGTEAATSEQKVRAYDLVQTLRPVEQTEFKPLLREIIGIEPTTVWLLTSAPLDREELELFSESVRGREISIHVVQAGSTAMDDWLQAWVARHNGTLTVLAENPARTPLTAQDTLRD